MGVVATIQIRALQFHPLIDSSFDFAQDERMHKENGLIMSKQLCSDGIIMTLKYTNFKFIERP